MFMTIEINNQMATQFTFLLSDTPKVKRHISFFAKEFTQVCTGINIEAVCSNHSCESVQNSDGLVIIKFSGITSCAYQEVVKFLRCSSCGCVIAPERVRGVVFVRCQATINLGKESVNFRVRGEETLLWELPFEGADVLITLLDKDPQPKSDSKDYLGEGVNHSVVSRNNECQESNTSARQMSKLCEVDVSGPSPTDVNSVHISTPETVKPDKGKPTSPKKTLTLSMLNQIIAVLMGKHNLAITPGLNLLAKCSNDRCPSNEKGIGVICIGIGSTNLLQYKEIILGHICPSCHQPVPLSCFKGIFLFQCKAKIAMCGEETEYSVGRIPEVFAISLESDEVEITVLETRAEITTGIKSPKTSKWSKGGLTHSESSERSFKRACIGLNLEAMCVNPNCEGSLVVIPCPNITECVYSSLLTGIACPGCQCEISPLCFIGITLVKCKAEVKIGNEKDIVTAEGDETVDIEVNLQGPEVYVSIINRHIFSSSELSGGSGKGYIRSTTGLNGIVVCENSECLAFRDNDGCVIVNFEDVSTGVLREVAKSMKCPACFQVLLFSNLKAVEFVRCSGQLQIGSENESFNSVGSTTSRFMIISGGSEVSFSIVKTGSFLEFLMPKKGLNLIGKCSNTSCPSQSQQSLEGVICLNVGEVTNCRLQRLIQNRSCPRCDHAIPTDSFISIIYTQCTAQVKTSEFVISYMVGQKAELVPIAIRTQPVIDILPIQTKNLSLEPVASPYKLMKRGMNLKVVCSNLDCATKKSSDGIIVISLQEMKLYKFEELLTTVNCIACQNTLSHMQLLTLSFVDCRAEMLVGKARFVIEAVNEEAIDLKLDFSTSDITIHVMEKEADISLLFPEIQSEGSTSKAGTYSYHSPCHGLNFIVICSNPICESVKNSDMVVIRSGHILHCDLRPVIQLLNCSSCEDRISPLQVREVELVCCSGEIIINGKMNKFNPTGSVTSRFKIPCDNSPVIMKVYHREYNVVQNPVFAYKRRPFNKHHNGINFRCYCKNPSCTAVKERSGLVVVQRNNLFIREHGYHPDTCYYSQEISHLKCSSCGSHLKKYYVWGVGLVHCKGTIIRYGSPSESFYPSTGDVVEYQLDAEDTSLKIEFKLTWSIGSFLL